MNLIISGTCSQYRVSSDITLSDIILKKNHKTIKYNKYYIFKLYLITIDYFQILLIIDIHSRFLISLILIPQIVSHKSWVVSQKWFKIYPTSGLHVPKMIYYLAFVSFIWKIKYTLYSISFLSTNNSIIVLFVLSIRIYLHYYY